MVVIPMAVIERERRGDSLWITINRPEKMNALRLDDWRAIQEGIEQAGEDARSAVITGVDDVFCAGDDISVFGAVDGAQDIEKLCDRIVGAFRAIETAPVPVIAAVNGVSYGGGCELVIASDIAIATEDATFALPEAKIGGVAAFAVSRADVIGRKPMMELLVTGDSIDADQAAGWNLVNRVVPENELEPTVTELTATIASAPARSIRMSKRYVNAERWATGERDRMLGRMAHLFHADAIKDAAAEFSDE